MPHCWGRITAFQRDLYCGAELVESFYSWIRWWKISVHCIAKNVGQVGPSFAENLANKLWEVCINRNTSYKGLLRIGNKVQEVVWPLMCGFGFVCVPMVPRLGVHLLCIRHFFQNDDTYCDQEAYSVVAKLVYEKFPSGGGSWGKSRSMAGREGDFNWSFQIWSLSTATPLPTQPKWRTSDLRWATFQLQQPPENEQNILNTSPVLGVHPCDEYS